MLRRSLNISLDQSASASTAATTADLYTAVSASATAGRFVELVSDGCRRCARGFSFLSSLLVIRCSNDSRNEQYSLSGYFSV